MSDKNNPNNGKNVAGVEDAEPDIKAFLSHPWFIISIAGLVATLIFIFMNKEPVAIRYIGFNGKLNLFLLVIICTAIGAAIEFFISLGSRMGLKHENRELKRRIKELEHRR